VERSSQFGRVLADNGNAVEAMLDKLLSYSSETDAIKSPQRLMEAMRYATLGAGKRIRPFLMIETAKLFNIHNEAIVRGASAIEMIHCYSLIHDDLPAMDDDAIRRGKPTVHVAYDEATAILAGDALLTLAFEVMADERVSPDTVLRAKLVTVLAKAAGARGMVGGQMLDILAESLVKPLTHAEIQTLQSMKTGALLHVSVISGGLFANCDPDTMSKLHSFGRKLGAIFQISDDILDYTGDAALMGKKIGKDAGRNKATLVSILGLDTAKAQCAKLAEEAKSVLTSIACSGSKDILLETVDFIVSRNT